VETTVPLISRMLESETDELLIAYGPSGSGKTYTLGSTGILGKSVEYLLSRIGEQQMDHSLRPMQWNNVCVVDDNVPLSNIMSQNLDQPVYSIWLSFIEVGGILNMSTDT
jgi:ABC-type lipoprotein export system ATPase subunit